MYALMCGPRQVQVVAVGAVPVPSSAFCHSLARASFAIWADDWGAASFSLDSTLSPAALQCRVRSS